VTPITYGALGSKVEMLTSVGLALHLVFELTQDEGGVTAIDVNSLSSRGGPPVSSGKK
jgi:hypothetical protein